MRRRKNGAKSVKSGDMCGGFYTLQDRRLEMRSISGGTEKTDLLKMQFSTDRKEYS